MAKPFLELFKKYEPGDSERNVISKIVEYSAKADKGKEWKQYNEFDFYQQS